MKNDSLKISQLSALKGSTLKKIWVKPEVEMISVLSGSAAGYEGGFPPGSFFFADVS